jgi:glycosyltransferase involved in cell wall biosynthesis
MGYPIVEIDLGEPQPRRAVPADAEGLAFFARWRGRLVGFEMIRARGDVRTDEVETPFAAERWARQMLAATAEDALDMHWTAPARAPAPALTIAICTKDRARRLRRLLASLAALPAPGGFASLEVLVIDNASVDAATRLAVADFPGFRCVREPTPGLDFARNAALESASGDLIAYLDDDVVVDRGWLDGLHAAWRACPGAGGYTGLVLPYRLDTDAQVEFERGGGFRRGFTFTDFRGARQDNALHPVGAGIVGAGCNMAFDRRLLIDLGGFDEALDTGAPLPGGGDLDIFYRVLRAGRTMVYEPRYAVYHEHRQSLAALRRQYWTWGQGFMAYLVKIRRSDGALKAKQDAMARWWFIDKAAAMTHAIVEGRPRRVWMLACELWGGLVGLFGEYDRSRARSARLKAKSA